MDVGDIFVGEVLLGVPTVAEEYNRKMPGAADSNGDHCVQ